MRVSRKIPRELARSLETFQMIKEVRRRISELMEEERPYHGKEPEDVRNAAFTGSIPVARLQAAFFALYDAIHEEEERWVPPEEVSLEAEIETLGSTLKRQGKVEFRSYLQTEDKAAAGCDADGSFGADAPWQSQTQGYR